MKENLQEEIIDVKGLHCKSCTENIQTKLSQLDGIDKVRVSLVEEKAFVRFDSSKINIGGIRKEIESMGYGTEISYDTSEPVTDSGPAKESDAKTDDNNSRRGSLKQGIVYGLIPHTGCIAFIIGSVLGVTVLTQFFRPLLLNPYFFYILIGISFSFATISALVYLKKQGFMTFGREGIDMWISFSNVTLKRKWKYLSTLYGSTIGINLLLFMVIFPLMANVSIASPITGGVVASDLSTLKLQVDIPCSGHATLISGDLKEINGIVGIQFSLPNIFDVTYDPSKTSKQQILALDVFNTYKATVLSESSGQVSQNQLNLAGANDVTSSSAATASGGTLATVTNGVQIVQLSVQGTNYYPNPIRVKIGIPVQLVADINNMPGCSKSIVIPEFGISKSVSASDNTIEFTPNKSGTFQFSCSMNMYHGQIIVENADGSVAAYTGSAPVSNGGTCGGAGGGCGCGSK